MGDVWYNIGIVAVHVGDIGLAYQANKLAVTCNPELAEAYGVGSVRCGKGGGVVRGGRRVLRGKRRFLLETVVSVCVM